MSGALGSISDPYQLLYYPGYFDQADAIGRTTFVAASSGLTTFTYISIGQSTPGNNSSGTYTVTQFQNHNFCYNNGCIYLSAARMFGCGDSFHQTSYLARLNDKIITGGARQRVIAAPMAIDGSLISQHAVGGVYNHHIGVMARRMQAIGLVPNGILVSIGESDAQAGTSQAAFQAGLTSMLGTFTANGITCPAYIEKCTWISGSQPAGAAAIRAAIDAVVNGTTIKAGPDTDTLDNTNRQDTTHWNATGADAAASLWKTALGL